MITVRNRAALKTKEILFRFSKNENAKSLNYYTQRFDNVPLVYLSKKPGDHLDGTIDYSGVTIEPQDIIFVKLFNSKFLPELELSCQDATGQFYNDFFPFDHDTLISIFVKSPSENVYPIRMDFRVTEYEIIKSHPGENNTYKYHIRGILDVDDFYFTKYESFKNQTSYQVLKQLATNMNLGFASNIEGSNDAMTWVNPSNTYIEFMKDVTGRAYVSDNSFVWSFVDFYYNLNFIDVEVELDESPKEMQILNNKVLQSGNVKDADVVPLYLSNNPILKTTNKYIDKFDLLNQSFKVNLDKSYRLRATWFDTTERTIHRKFINDLSTEDESIKPLYDYDSDIYRNYRNDDYILVKVIEDNNHKNYAVALKINEFNLENIQKVKMVVTLNQVNFDLKRFQKINVEMYNIETIFSKRSSSPYSAINSINETLSGYWLVTGINYIYKRSGGVSQEVTLSRRDLNLTYKEVQDLRKLFEKKINQ